MNVQMWLNSATQRNSKTLKNDNVTFIGPEVGSMACGEYGEGRLSDPKNIIESTINFIESYDFKPLKNYSALVTSGPTHEMIDPVRFISNKSSGKQGFAIAENLSRLGAKTTIISGPTDQEFPSNCIIDRVTTASEMLDACVSLLPTDIAVCAAAVGDFKIANKNIQKIKKTGNEINLALEENPDILKSISTRNSQRPKLVIGFAAETNDLIDNAKSKLNSKGCDWILANDISNGKVIGKDNNKVSLVSNLGVESWPDMSKHNVAKKLSEKIVNHFSSN